MPDFDISAFFNDPCKERIKPKRADYLQGLSLLARKDDMQSTKQFKDLKEELEAQKKTYLEPQGLTVSKS